MLAAIAGSAGLATTRDGGETWRAAKGLEGLQIFAVSIDPNQPEIALAGSNEGLFRSIDGGQTWQHIPGLPEGLLAYALATDVRGALYLGGDRPHVWRSVDRGVTWQALPPLPQGSAVLSVAAPADGQMLLAGTDGAGLWISRDGGQSWQAANGIGDTFVAGIWLLDDAGRAAFARTREGLFRSLDAGATWRRVASQIEERIDALAYAPADGWVYLAISDGHVFRGRVAGDEWTPTGAGLGRAGAVFTVQTVPGVDGSLIAGSQSGLYRSDDHGASWQHMVNGPGPMPALGLAQSPNSVLFLVNADGVYTSSDAGDHWTRSSTGLPGTSVLAIAVSPADPQVVYAGTDGQGLFRSIDGSQTWSATALDVPAVPAIAPHPRDPQRVLARAAFQRVYESRDGGLSWQTNWEGMDLQTEVISLLVDPNNPERIFAGAVTGLYRSLDDGQTWQRVGPELDGQTVFALLVDPVQPARLLAGVTNGVYESMDGGDHWTTSSRGLEQVTVTALAMHPTKKDVVYAGTKYRGVYRSADGGRTWQADGDGLGPVSVNALTVTSDGRWLLAATAEGVFRRAAP